MSPLLGLCSKNHLFNWIHMIIFPRQHATALQYFLSGRLWVALLLGRRILNGKNQYASFLHRLDWSCSSITARWHRELTREPTRTPGLIVIKAKWQWGLSVVSHISCASPKIFLDSVCYPSFLINLNSHMQDLYCVSHSGYKLPSPNSSHDSRPPSWENNWSFCFKPNARLTHIPSSAAHSSC